jgi:FkbM family methyltransferase
MNKLEGFPTINCISLEESIARRELLSSQFSEYGLIPNYLLSKRYTECKDIVFGASLHSVDEKVIACTISHLKMIKKWYDTTDEEYGFFCEDDLSLETILYWGFTFNSFMQQLPSDWEALQLCIIRDSFIDIFSETTVLETLKERQLDDWSVTAYILKREYAKKLIDQYIFQLKDILYNLPPYWGEATAYKLEVNNWPQVQPLAEHIILLNTGKVYCCPLFIENISGPTTSSNEQAPNHIYSSNFIMDWWKKLKTELIPINIGNTTITYTSLKEKYNMNIKGIIHVGAHYGEEIKDYIESGVKKLVLFEPLKDNFNIILNKIKNLDVDITLHQTALGSYVTEEIMYVSDNEKLSSSLLKPKNHLLQYPDVYFPDTEKVKINLLDNYQYTEYNYLHMDVQGYELEVLKGAVETLKYIDYIYCEVNRDELYEKNVFVEDLDNFLLKYNMKRVETDWKGESWGDALYIKN